MRSNGEKLLGGALAMLGREHAVDPCFVLWLYRMDSGVKSKGEKPNNGDHEKRRDSLPLDSHLHGTSPTGLDC